MRGKANMAVGTNNEVKNVTDLKKLSETHKIIDQIKLYIKNHLGDQVDEKESILIEKFAERYYGVSSLDDLRMHPIPDLYAMLLSHWKFIYQRRPDESKIRIFNPTFAQDGWDSTHTVIQISHADIPFLVDSTRMAINRYGYQIHFIIHFGGFKVKRDSKHHIIDFYSLGSFMGTEVLNTDASTEAPIYIEIDRITDPKAMEELEADIQHALSDVRAAVADWYKMIEKVKDSLRTLDAPIPNLDQADIAESRDFLHWMINNHFTFLGSRDYKVVGNDTNRALQLIPGSGLGVLRDETFSTVSKRYADLPPKARKMALSNNVLYIGQTHTKATVHRDDNTYTVSVKEFDENGELVGERRFIGLYTSTAYHSSPRHIPFLRHKVEKVLKGLNYPSDSHDGKEAVHILETLPRDDLFQATHEELLYLTLSIIQLKERKRVRLLVRRDAFNRYFSCLVFVPREIFTTELALQMQDILIESFKGIECSFTTYFSDSVLARIHFLVRVNPKTPLNVEIEQIEKQLIRISRSWAEELKDALQQRHGEPEGLKLYAKYHKAFPVSYSEYYTSTEALDDIEQIEHLSESHPLCMSFNKASERNTLSLKLFHAEQTIVLSDVLPILENMGLRIIGERPYCVKLREGKSVWINDFDMTCITNRDINITKIRGAFQEAFTKIWFGDVENDGFNRLVLEANLTWQEIAMLRAYTKYLRQTGFTFSQQYIESALINNADITSALVKLFILCFDPMKQDGNEAVINETIAYIQQSLEQVASLDEDRILRRLLEVMRATLRTNYFQTTDHHQPKPYLSFKLNPEAISDLPAPQPKFEIFVYSPRVEGVHLRGGKVSRGGLRWSDRREDYRLEVQGLMEAQQVKNTVIVPEGAKGGFIVKQTTPDMNRDDYLKEGIQCYSMFICGLLDVTDNIKDGVVVPPENVVRYDEDDPYLVVAADKGTATFSDIANSIAQKYGFWLDDAFASGGSAGYDHKKMGITSRGVWVSVKRHFREIGINPDTDDFTVVGIGDMSGDVFGNGMLLSPHIKLVGAFNHMHIFIDPDPDAAKSYEERKRLFNLSRSTWLDYNPALISQGGGVFNRSLKSIKLTPEMQRLLNTDKEALVPNELIRAMLKSPVDLIWNGGIGTFVKSSEETHADVGDRSSENIRVNGDELNAKVIAEGGNLGMTQLARIEYSLNGGIVNTDFIDNSAGVDCSDHEVNIKILLNRLIADGLMTFEERNKLLENMTDEVAALVLLDNYDQTQILSLETSVSQQTMDLFRHYISELEKQDRIDRELKHLPDDTMLLERKTNNKPLTRPEIAMLLAYSKMYLKKDLLETDLPDDLHFNKYLLKAFPKALGENYYPQMKEHSLRREIIATQLCKMITDHMGINFIERLQRETGASMAFAIRGFSIAAHIFKLEKLFKEISSLDNVVSPIIQHRMMLQVYYLIRRTSRWFLRNRKPNIHIEHSIHDFEDSVYKLTHQLADLFDAADKENYDATITYLLEQDVPKNIARHIAACNGLFTSLDIADAARKYNLPLEEVAKTYYLLGNKLELNWLRTLMNEYVVENEWDELARAGFRDDLDRVQGELSARVLMTQNKDTKIKSIEERIEWWVNRYEFLVNRWQKLIGDLRSSENVEFVTYAVILRELFDFALTT